MDKVKIKEYLILNLDGFFDNKPLKKAKKELVTAKRSMFDFCVRLGWEKQLSSNEQWIYDNYYYWEKCLFSLKKSKLDFSRGLIRACNCFIECCDFEVNKEGIEALFDVVAIKKCFEERFFQNIGAAILFCLLIKIKSDTLNGCINSKKLICSLRFVNEYDFNRLICGYSEIERIFRTHHKQEYIQMDQASCNVYKKALERLSKKKNKPMDELLKEYISVSKEKDIALGELLLDHSPKRWYFPLFGICLLSVLSGFVFLLYPLLSKPILFLVLILLFPCAFKISFFLINTLSSKIVKNRILLSNKCDKCTDDSRTCVVITGLLCNTQDVEKYIRSLEECFLRQFPSGKRDENVYFGLIGDLFPSKTPKTSRDQGILNVLEKNLERLNEIYNGGFFAYVREREFSPTEGCFIPKERKRGAICDFALDSIDNTSPSRVLGDQNALKNIKYLITLDADTSMGFGDLFKLVGVMKHPLNKAKIAYKNGQKIVYKGYGVVQPYLGVSLTKARSTPFARLIGGAGGRDRYQSGAFNLFRDVFGVGMFCGKGIIDLAAYREVCSDAFRDGTVLSHDILEGSRLRCAYCENVVFSDGVPQDTLSFYQRRHRWIRGDTQSLSYALAKVKNAEGVKFKNPIEPVFKLCIWDNFINSLCSISLFFIIAIGMFVNGATSYLLCLLGSLYLIAPFLVTVLHNIKSFGGTTGRNYYSGVYSAFWSTVLNFFKDMAFLAKDAFNGLDAIIRSLYRMLFSHKKLLEWKTFSSVTAKGFAAYLYDGWQSAFMGGVFLLISPNRPGRLFGLIWLVYPLISFILSTNKKKSPSVKESDIQTLNHYLKDSFRFFEDNVNKSSNFLPPDFISISPCSFSSLKASPTNIGLYLLTVLGARDIGIINTARMTNMLKDTLGTLERMEKFKGNFYNWYDTESLEILGNKYISTVDSGNLAAFLLALEMGLKDYCLEDGRIYDIIIRIKNLREAMDFSFLYDRAKSLFFVGYDVAREKADEAHYDLYMSECRLTSYYCVAKGLVPFSHWQSLGRNLCGSDRHIGAASWTGTCFEYFMPLLLLPVFRDSFEFESICFAFDRQRKFKSKIGGIYGVSESAYFSFDSMMNYQYKAMGVPSLRLKRENDDTLVISPYSSFLMLKMDPASVMANLKNIKKRGMYGKYGYYEALDCSVKRTGGCAIVKSYMTHHIGMSFISALNLIYPDKFVDRFCRDDNIKASLILLQEKIPVDSPVHVNPDNERIMPLKDKKEARARRLLKDKSDHVFLHGKDCAFISSADGRCTFLGKQKSSLVFSEMKRSLYSSGLVVKVFLGDKVFSQIKDLNPQESIYSAYDHGSVGEVVIRYKKLIISIRFVPLQSVSGSLAVYVDVNGYSGHIKTEISFSPILQDLKRFNSHPAFNRLFLEYTPERDFNGVLIKRRKRDQNECEEFALAAFTEKEHSELQIVCDGESKIYHGLVDSGKFFPLMGSVIRLSQSVTVLNPSHKQRFEALICCSNQYDQVRSSMKEGLDILKSFAKQSKDLNVARRYSFNYPIYDNKIENAILEKMLNLSSGSFASRAESYKINDLWSCSVSGDNPIVTVCMSNLVKDGIRSILQRYKLHYLSGLVYDLVVLVDDGGYNRGDIEEFNYNLFQSGAGFLLGQSPGIHPISPDEDSKSLFKATSFLYYEDNCFLCDLKYESFPEVERIQSNENNGAFTSNGYLMTKSSDKYPVWSYVISSPISGSVITDRDLGYTWFSNCSLKRISAWKNTPYGSERGEQLLLKRPNGTFFDLVGSAMEREFKNGYCIYKGLYNENEYSVCVSMNPRWGYKEVKVDISNSSMYDCELCYKLEAAMGSRGNECGKIICVKDNKTISFYRNIDNDLKSQRGFIKCAADGVVSDIELGLYKGGVILAKKRIKKEKQIKFLLGVYSSIKHLEMMSKDFKRDSSKEASNYCVELLGEYNTSSLLSKPFIYPFWLSYQCVFGRLLAKSGFYQSGGAFGFRDQLQDSLCCLDFYPYLTKMTIIRCACHQFEQGDVLHWWHNLGSGGHSGVRSRCSDDYLWLIWAVYEYIGKTNDASILETRLPFLTGDELKDRTNEEYRKYTFTKEKYPLKEHLERCVKLLISRGEGNHGILLMGSGDWNDGMNLVGENGGESVWLTQFGIICLSRALDLKILSEEEANKVKQKIEFLLYSLDKCFNGRWYPRAYFSDNKPLGNDLSVKSECSVDLLPQVFSVFCYYYVPDSRNEERKRRMICAIKACKEILCDKKNSLIKLFSHPFDSFDKDPGYIKGYVAGVRENGGQYTHAAIWYLWALRFLTRLFPEEVSFKEELDSSLEWLLPENKSLSVYRNEPYVLSGDVYTAKGYVGRGGWSWYTGAAGWLYRLLRDLDHDIKE